MLLNIHLHNPFLPRYLLDLREQFGLFHLMMCVQDFSPAFGVIDEVGVVFRGDVRRLKVDAVQSSDEDIVPQRHGTRCCNILIVWLLQGPLVWFMDGR